MVYSFCHVLMAIGAAVVTAHRLTDVALRSAQAESGATARTLARDKRSSVSN
jgi:hypothetical protein